MTIVTAPPLGLGMTKTWGKLIGSWTLFLKATGSPSTTREQRLYHVRRLASEIGCEAVEVTLEGLVGWLASKDWQPNTRRAYRASFRAFWGWLLATGRARTSPAHQLPPVRIPRARPRPAPESAVKRALLLVSDRRAYFGIRLAAHCGLRRGEVARVRSSDVEEVLTGWSLRVRGKGGHERIVPLPDDLARELMRQPEGWLFPSSHGGHLTPAYVGKLIARHLPGDLTTHTLRHRCATVAYAATKDLRAVQELLGHAKPETTAIYTAVPDDDVRRAMLAAAA
ncbi:integrase [Nocardioides zeae]|uniref:Integrase n=1 Tax=Nocardioides zeae TaxID=1457234 RepID=A0ACC6IND9_9ACTN|nr:tyrosine-type recombinase/integrase [Nocardioides zeae]MDR6212163.1 integrase [Nocardioides zeae]